MADVGKRAEVGPEKGTFPISNLSLSTILKKCSILVDRKAGQRYTWTTAARYALLREAAGRHVFQCKWGEIGQVWKDIASAITDFVRAEGRADVTLTDKRCHVCQFAERFHLLAQLIS
jgi:hypothetical protein